MQQFVYENVLAAVWTWHFSFLFKYEIKPKTINSQRKNKKDGPIDCTRGFVWLIFVLFCSFQTRLHGKLHLIPHVAL